MPSLEIIGIYVLLCLNIVLTILMIREVALRVLESVSELDSNLAEVVSNIGQSLPAMTMEGVNPIQMAIAQWIGSQADAKNNVFEGTVTTVKDPSGQFAPSKLE